MKAKAAAILAGICAVMALGSSPARRLKNAPIGKKTCSRRRVLSCVNRRRRLTRFEHKPASNDDQETQ